MKRFILVAVVGMMLLASPVIAKEGLYVGAYVLPSIDVSEDSGDGYGFRAGFGVNRYFAVEGSYEKGDLDKSGDFTGMALDLKVNFPLTSLDRNNVMSLEPFVRLGYAEYEDDADNSGSGPHFGIGIELYLFQELSVSAGWSRTVADFDGNDERIKVIDLGLNYHFR
ncbi:MAG: hypothetical protein A2010_01315 [Nitrospirae bacterium GWD2_57_9]|nr:MAG: hypothetical protein A2010_01315 [Nitrospirae bacterium GWD2_57_9]